MYIISPLSPVELENKSTNGVEWFCCWSSCADLKYLLKIHVSVGTTDADAKAHTYNPQKYLIFQIQGVKNLVFRAKSKVFVRNSNYFGWNTRYFKNIWQSYSIVNVWLARLINITFLLEHFLALFKIGNCTFSLNSSYILTVSYYLLSK